MNNILTGFGFGPIQSGLFVKEAFQSGNFRRIVIAEIDQSLIDAVRANAGTYYVNIAKANGIEISKIEGVELYNPAIETDRNILIEALKESTEITTCLPSVSFYSSGENSVAKLIGIGLQKSKAPATIIYASENNNHAAEILQKACFHAAYVIGNKIQFLNTVIGKMSRVITDPVEISEMELMPIVPGMNRAFLVEEFSKILVTKCAINDFKPGISVFTEKDDLLPFEEAKLYGHNAIHAILAYLGAVKNYKKMTELKTDPGIMKVARDAFLKESGEALIKKYAAFHDELFTEAGYKQYAEDLLERMTNPFLADSVERAGRDPIRKLGYDDRIFGTMALVMEHGIEPTNMALGAIAGVAKLPKLLENCSLPDSLCFSDWRELDNKKIDGIIKWVWNGRSGKYAADIIKLVQNSRKRLENLVGNTA